MRPTTTSIEPTDETMTPQEIASRALQAVTFHSNRHLPLVEDKLAALREAVTLFEQAENDLVAEETPEDDG